MKTRTLYLTGICLIQLVVFSCKPAQHTSAPSPPKTYASIQNMPVDICWDCKTYQDVLDFEANLGSTQLPLSHMDVLRHFGQYVETSKKRMQYPDSVWEDLETYSLGMFTKYSFQPFGSMHEMAYLFFLRKDHSDSLPNTIVLYEFFQTNPKKNLRRSATKYFYRAGNTDSLANVHIPPKSAPDTSYIWQLFDHIAGSVQKSQDWKEGGDSTNLQLYSYFWGDNSNEFYYTDTNHVIHPFIPYLEHFKCWYFDPMNDKDRNRIRWSTQVCLELAFGYEYYQTVGLNWITKTLPEYNVVPSDLAIRVDVDYLPPYN